MNQQQYEKLDSISHIHKRPDMYVGSIKPRIHEKEWILNQEKTRMELKENIIYSDGLIRIFVEALSNAIDNVWRSKEKNIKVSKIEIKCDFESGKTSIWNDGLTIPHDIHLKENIYIPELIFGHLLTGSNLNDDEKRLSSGRNGLGIKLLNVFSKEFSIELINDHQQIYKQSWNSHMRQKTEPVIKSIKKKPSTFVEWIPDFSLFHMQKYDTITLDIYEKLCIDTAMITGIPIFWNNTKYFFKSFSDYTKYYQENDSNIITFDILSKDEKSTSHFGIMTSNNYQEIGFVNGIYTKEGGIHMDAFSNEFFKSLLIKLQQKLSTDNISLTIKDIKPHFTLFANVWIENPEFSTQSKTKLIGPSFKIKIEEKFLDKIMKWNFVHDLQEMIKTKQLINLKKTEKKSRSGYKKIEGLDKANLAGSKKSNQCTLILCEGLSAKTFAVKGIVEGWNNLKGRDYFGIYALRGKLLNVRNASISSITNNREITDIIQALNLRYQTDYTIEENFKSLHYGQLMILTDADADGHHICSLILNFIHTLFPSLLKREKPFIWYMMTPISRMFIGKEEIIYYNDYEYQKKLLEMKGKKFQVKYYKGLGTSSDKEIKETFGKKVVSFITDEYTDDIFQKIFHKTFTNERKDWLANYNPFSYKNPTNQYTISDYLNQELIQFSLDDCKRSLPNIFDGLKVSQRKILYSVFKKNLIPHGKSMKVAQLSGYCAEVSNYHHGEQCLFETIIKMAHNFPGSNNIPFLQRDGQFGSRAYGGKDSANARYIFTKLSELTRLLFPEQDDSLLSYTLDDGDFVEPDFYCPIVPTILGNGCNAGIGTGWSCSIPSFSFLDLINLVEKWIHNKDDIHNYDFDLLPFYNGFKGTIEKIDTHKYKSNGILTKLDTKKNTWIIEELPLYLWTNKYKEELESMMEEKKITSFKNYSTSDSIHFEITMDSIPTLESLKLTSNIYSSNMVLFVDNNIKIQKFNHIKDIFLLFCQKRSDLYQKRYDKLLSQLQINLKRLQNQLRFLKEIDNETLLIFKREESDIINDLIEKKFSSDPKSDDSNDFNYLLNLSFRDVTLSKFNSLQKNINHLENEILNLQQKHPHDLWLSDLSNLKQKLFI